MTLEQIDQLLADWRKKLDPVGQNLMDLHGLPTYQWLSGAPGFPKVQLMGITQARVTPALEAMNDLFQHFDLLLNTVNKATELRKQVSWFLVSEGKAKEAQAAFDQVYFDLPGELAPKLALGLAAEQAVNFDLAIKMYDLVSQTSNLFTRSRVEVARTLINTERSAPGTNELKEASVVIEALTLEGIDRYRLTKQVLETALNLVTSHALSPVSSIAILGQPLRELYL